MFCKNCGVQLQEGEKSCKSCGVAVEEQAASNNGNVVVAKKVASKKNPIMLLVAAIVAVVVFVVVFKSGSSVDKTIDNFFEGLFEGDSKLFVSTLSDAFIEEQLDYYGYRNKAVLTEKLQNNMDELAEEYKTELGRNWKYEYEVVDTYEEEGMVEVTINLELSGRKGEESDVWILVLIEEGNEWYVDSFYRA